MSIVRDRLLCETRLDDIVPNDQLKQYEVKRRQFERPDEEKPVDAKTTDEKTIVSELPTSDHSMLRHEGLPQGFQPLTVAGHEIDATYLEETRGDNYGVIVFLHDHKMAYHKVLKL